MKGWIKILMGLLGVLGLVSILLPIPLPPLEVIWRLLFGWITYLGGVWPAIRWNYEAILSGVVFFVLALVGLHLVGRYVVKRFGKGWRWRWSIFVMMMLMAVLSVSLAIGGIAHQAGWLAKTDRWLDDGLGIQREKNKARQLLTALRIYAADHSGTFPWHLDDLVVEKILELDALEKFVVVEEAPGKTVGTWIYVSDLADSAPGEIPVLIGPLMRSGRFRLVGMVDSSVGYLREDEFRTMLKEVVKKNFSGPRDEIPPEYKPFLEES